MLGRCLAALAVVAGEHFQDNWVMHRGGASLTTDPTWTVNPESSWSTDQWRRALFGGGGGAPASGAPPAFGAPPLDDDPWAAARAARDATWDAAASGYSWGDDGGGGSGKDPWAHIRRR